MIKKYFMPLLLVILTWELTTAFNGLISLYMLACTLPIFLYITPLTLKQNHGIAIYFYKNLAYLAAVRLGLVLVFIVFISGRRMYHTLSLDFLQKISISEPWLLYHFCIVLLFAVFLFQKRTRSANGRSICVKFFLERLPALKLQLHKAYLAGNIAKADYLMHRNHLHKINIILNCIHKMSIFSYNEGLLYVVLFPVLFVIGSLFDFHHRELTIHYTIFFMIILSLPWLILNACLYRMGLFYSNLSVPFDCEIKITLPRRRPILQRIKMSFDEYRKLWL